MAEHIVKPIGKETIIIKCKQCKTLYVPDKNFAESRFYTFEQCPVCGEKNNQWDHVIPLWKYNLIKTFREMFKNG